MYKLRISDSDFDLDKIEKYLQKLEDRFSEDHGYSDVKITFSRGRWGFIDNGNFNEIGSLPDLDKWLRTAHCEKCSKKHEQKKYDIQHHTRDEDGHLENFEEWNDIWLNIIAKEEGVDVLTEEHMLIINFLRTYYSKNRVPPMIRVLTLQTGVNTKKIYDLFPNGASSACKIAGIPRAKGDW